MIYADAFFYASAFHVKNRHKRTGAYERGRINSDDAEIYGD